MQTSCCLHIIHRQQQKQRNKKGVVTFLISLSHVRERSSKFLINDIYTHIGWIQKCKVRKSCWFSMNVVWNISNFVIQDMTHWILSILESSVILAKSLISLSNEGKIQAKSCSLYKIWSLINITITYITVSHVAVIHQHIFLSSDTSLKEVSLTKTYWGVKGKKLLTIKCITQLLWMQNFKANCLVHTKKVYFSCLSKHHIFTEGTIAY